MIVRTVFPAVICLALAAAAAGDPESAKEEAAVSVAEQWLKLVDNGEYEESWKEASGYFRNAVTEEDWERSLRAVRQPLGKVISREVGTTTSCTSLPGAPDGEYVVVQFTTSFENKEAAVETVTPMIDEDGQWRVSGYYIK